MPGAPQQQVELRFDSTKRDTNFRKEVGVYVVQDATGRVDGLLPSQPGYAHCDCQFDRPMVTVGDVTLSRGGRLSILDDPEIREVAARFGPPDVVLDDNPQLILPRRYTGGSTQH